MDALARFTVRIILLQVIAVSGGERRARRKGPQTRMSSFFPQALTERPWFVAIVREGAPSDPDCSAH
eukprot:3346676-Karenia_brevis.AAC.1